MTSSSTTSSSNDMGDYRAALALNNMAITMIQRGFSREAALTMKDSQSLMNTAFGLQQGTPQQALEAATMRLSKAQHHSSNKRQGEQVPELDENDHLALFSTACHVATRGEEHPAAPLPFIRITSFGEDHWVTRDVLQHSVTIYYNQALTYLALAEELSSSRQRKIIRQRALDSLKMAFEMIEDVLTEEEVATRSDETIKEDGRRRLDHFWYWTCLAVLTLRAQERLYQAMGKESKAREVHSMALELARELTEAEGSVSEVVLLGPHQPVLAAAA